MWIIDVSSFASVKALGDRYEKEGHRLDIVVMNAAILPSPTPTMTDDGWEISSVCHFWFSTIMYCD